MGPAEHASGHRPYGQNLQSGSSAGASGQRNMSKIATIARSRVTWLQTLVDSQTQLILPLSQRRLLNRKLSNPGSLKHYFYDLRSTPTPDTDSFTPRQRKQIQRLNPSCHISSSSATGICSPLRLQHRGLLTFFGRIEEYDWWFFTSFFSSFSI